MSSFPSRQLVISWLILMGLLLSTCKGSPAIDASEVPPSEAVLSQSTSVPTATDTPPQRVILLTSPQADVNQVSKVQALLTTLAEETGLQLEIQTSLSAEAITPEVRLVIIFAPSPETEAALPAIINAAANTQFLAIALAGLPATDNLLLIGPQGYRTDQLGFMAGYIAAITTQDWRVGIIGISNTAAGKAASRAFSKGVTFFCGLCRPAYPPFIQYPVVSEVSAGATQVEWQVAADNLIANAVKTVYVVPSSGGDELMNYLAQSGVNLIGNQPAPEALRSQWLASIQFDPLPIIQAQWSELVSSISAGNIPLPIVISDVNQDLLSPGRQNLVQKTLQDLLDGYIDTGVDPLSGELR